eukprot:TRINITY_DN17757_c0_g1_i1.p1 TRINITY_DN17757_c0_g1~~TRINITY_DN17757_c0_g1_i1.p1  ORF type:complete len:185 (+),score=55.64 TRINITY_DN17757_c0_g1_i1:13-567(+)
MLWRKGCGAVIFNDAGEIVAGKRTELKKTDVGTWELPQGGYSRRLDSSRLEGAKREIYEEIGIKADENLTLVKEVEEELQYRIEGKITLNKGQKIQYFVFYWKDADLSQCKLDVGPQEFSELAFLSWDDVVKKVAEGKTEMYKELRESCQSTISDFLAEKNGENTKSKKKKKKKKNKNKKKATS